MRVDLLYIEGMKWKEYPVPPTENMQMVEEGRTKTTKTKKETRRNLEQRDTKG